MILNSTLYNLTTSPNKKKNISSHADLQFAFYSLAMIGFVNAFCIFIHGADGDTDQRNNSYSTHLAKLTTPPEKVSGSSIGVIKVSVNTINNHIGVFLQRFDDFNPILGFFTGGQMSVTGRAIWSTAGAIALPVNMLDEALF